MLAMTLWWVVPLFVVNIMTHPSLLHMQSHMVYIVIIFLSASAAFTLIAISAATNIWAYATNWGRYHILCTVYTIQMIFTLLIVLALNACRMIGYYGGDPEGSVGMLFIPSTLLYFVLGVFVRWGCKVDEWIRERQRTLVIRQVRKERIAKHDQSADRRRGEGGWIGVIFMLKFGLLILGTWIAYQSWQAGTLEEDMTRYADEIIEAVKTTLDSRESRSTIMPWK